VYVIIYGYDTKFTKNGGTIHGSDGGTLKNTATGGDGYGHAVYINYLETIPARISIRNTTAGEGVTLDNTKSGAAGGWE
jgi:hypothetical protein